MENKETQLLRDFKLKYETPGMKAQIVNISTNYGLYLEDAEIQFSLFDIGQLKFRFNIDTQRFKNILKENTPDNIFYNTTNRDDYGVYGNFCIMPGKGIEIVLSSYMYDATELIKKEGGYVDKVITSEPNNYSGVFVLDKG